MKLQPAKVISVLQRSKLKNIQVIIPMSLYEQKVSLLVINYRRLGYMAMVEEKINGCEKYNVTLLDGQEEVEWESGR